MREDKAQARELIHKAREERSEAKQQEEWLREERDKAREESRKAKEDKERLESKVALLQERCDRLSRRVRYSYSFYTGHPKRNRPHPFFTQPTLEESQIPVEECMISTHYAHVC